MKHSLADLFNIAYRYYPVEMSPIHPLYGPDPRYAETEEQRRLVAARREAGAARGPWRAMLQRLQEQFPDLNVYDNALCCPGEALDACYDGDIGLPEAPGEHSHSVELRVSFLVPYYVVYAQHLTDVPGTGRAWKPRSVRHRIMKAFWALPPGAPKPEAVAELERELWTEPPDRRRDVSFDLSPEEQPYGEAIAREVEATYGYELMPPEIGNVLVPHLTDGLGKASIYEWLFAKHL